DETPVGEATAVTIDQQNALQQITTGESNFDGEYTTSYTVVYIHNRNFLIITFAPTEELASYDPVLNAMTDSLQFAAPVTASTVTNDNFTTYTYGNQIAFRYPQTWVIEEDIGNDIEIVVSTSQELLDAAPEDARGAAVQISVKSAEEYDYLPGDSLVNTLDAIIADIIDADSEVDVVHATSETIINGLPAAATAFNMAQEGIEGYLTFALIPYGDSILLAWGVAIGGVEVEYIPVFDQVFATITVPDAYATYESDSDPITFNYPSHWIIDELEDGLVLQSDAELITDESFPTGALQFLFWREFDELLTPVEYAQIFVAEFNLIESQEAVLEPSALTINGQDAATATYTGEFFGSPVVVRYTTFIQGEQAVASIAITAV
ncbi:MAG: hypothetical protein GY943_35290, partial [Chloroflexi bacterium]|nr:hypothetical protein [Chloroflexota bacterium]